MKTVYKKQDEVARRAYDKSLQSPRSYGSMKSGGYINAKFAVRAGKVVRILYTGLSQ